MSQSLNIVKSKSDEMPNNIEAEQSVIGSVLLTNEIFDEVSLVLSSKNFYDPIHRKIFEALEKTRKAGVCIIYISHYLDEVFDVCQRIVVLRDGKNAGEFETTSSNHDEVLSAMLGNAVENLYPNKSKKENADQDKYYG